MKPDYHRIFRATHSNSMAAELLVRTRELIMESVKLLGKPVPDTFLGRRRGETAEPPDEER